MAKAGGKTGTAFVYGTLMAEEVVKVLIKRMPVNKPAVLRGYTRYCVRGQVFPAIVPTPELPDAKVQGKVSVEARARSGRHIGGPRLEHVGRNGSRSS